MYHFILRKILQDNILQFAGINRLGQIIAEALLVIHFSGSGDSIGRQSNDRSIYAEIIGHLLHRMEGLDTIHLGHSVIQEDYVVFILLYKPQGLHSAKGGIYLNSGLLKKSLHYSDICLCIIHHKNFSLRGMKSFFIIRPLRRSIAEFAVKVPNRLRIHHSLDNIERKLGALTVFALYIQLGVHHGKEAYNNVNSKAGSLYGPVPLFVYSLKSRG